MTKIEKEKLTMTLGTIGDCMSLISKYKADYKQAVDKILADCVLQEKTEWKYTFYKVKDKRVYNRN